MNSGYLKEQVPVLAARQVTELLSQERYPALNHYLEYQCHQAGSELWREGDSGNHLALILTGKLELLKETEFPGRPFVLGLFSAGSVIGEDSFLGEQPRQGTVRALEECETLTLSRENFEKLNQEQPLLANLILKWLLNLLSSRLHNTQGRLAAIF